MKLSELIKNKTKFTCNNFRDLKIFEYILTKSNKRKLYFWSTQGKKFNGEKFVKNLQN